MNSSGNPILKSYRIRAGITMGDPSGIGPEIILKAINTLHASRYRLHNLSGLAEFVVIGDKGVIERASRSVLHAPRIRFIDLNNVSRKNFRFGEVKAKYGRAAVEYLDKALELIKDKEIDCLVTCPVSKESINEAGLNFCGHTEYLAQKTCTEDFVMMLLNKYLKISLVTRHISLKDVPLRLNKDKIYKTVFLTYEALRRLFLIRNPRIVVCGLNPHASDNGLIGKEENRIIKPALRTLKRKIKYLNGPISADIAISKAKQKEYDCVIAMYHDQALIPLKILGKDTGVNITLGLPFIRTSPLHGTAFDIAGSNLANPASLVEAIRLAVRCTSNLKKD